MQALRKYGKDMQVVAEIIGNKTETHVRAFYANNERRYQLDKVIEQYNADNRDDMEENNEPAVPSAATAASSQSSQSKRMRSAAATD